MQCLSCGLSDLITLSPYFRLLFVIQSLHFYSWAILISSQKREEVLFKVVAICDVLEDIWQQVSVSCLTVLLL